MVIYLSLSSSCPLDKYRSSYSLEENPMKTFGIQLQEGSSISNLTVGAGTSFPADPNEGELFYRSDADITVVGLYAYINGNWDRISSSDSITAPKAASFPGTANVGDIFYKDSNDSAEGLYVYNGSTWDALTATATTFHVDAPTEVTLASTDNAIQLGATSGLNLVMDSTEIQARSNGGASSLMLNPHGGQLLIGKDTSRSTQGTPRLVQIEQASSTTSLQLVRNSNDIIDPNIQLGKTRGTAVGSNDIVQSGDALGSLIYLGATGTDLFTSAFTQVRAWGTISSTSVPARMDWWMTPEGGTSAAMKMSLMPDGQLLIGTQSVTDNEKLHVVTTSDGSNPVLQYLTNSGTTSGTGSTLAFAANTNSTAHTTLGTIAGVSSNATGSGNLIFSTATSGTVSEKMRITAAGNVGIGTTSPASAVQIGGDSAYRELRLRRSIDTATLAQAIAFYRTRGTEGAPTVVSSGDTLGSMIFTAFDGTTTGNAAWIQGAVDNTVSSNSTPGRLVFSTTATGAVTPTERMRIDSAGIVTIGSASASAPRPIEIAGGNTAGSVNVVNVETVTANQYSGITVVRNDNVTAQLGSTINLARTRGAVNGAVTAVSTGDTLGGIAFSGADGTDIRTNAAEILAAVDGTVGSSIMPGRLVFSTTPTGGNTPTERMRIDSTGLVLIGDTTSRTIAAYGATGATTHQLSSSGVAGHTVMRYSSTSAAQPLVVLAKSMSNTVGAHTTVASTNPLGALVWNGSDGTSFVEGARIASEVDGTVATGSVPAAILFATTTAGGTQPTERMRITSSGGIKLGQFTTQSASVTLAAADASAGKRVLVTFPSTGNWAGTVRVMMTRSTNDTTGTTHAVREFKIARSGNATGANAYFTVDSDVGGHIASAITSLDFTWYLDTTTGITYLRFGHGSNSVFYTVEAILNDSTAITVAVDGGTAPSGTVVTPTYALTNLGQAGSFAISTAGTARVLVDSSGHVGVGLTPSTVLDIKSKYGFSATSNGAIRIENYTSTTSASYLDNINGTALYDDSWYYGSGQRAAKDTTSSGILMSGGSIALTTDSGLTVGAQFTPTTRVNIDTSGNVGIGTTATGNRRLDILYNVNTAARVQFTNTDAGTGADARIVASNGASEIGMIMRGTGFTSAAGQGLLYVTNDNPIVFSTNGAERARIDSVGLGVGGTAASRVVEVHNNTRAIARLSANATTGTDALGAIEFSSYDGTSVGVGATIIHTYNLQSSDPSALTINVIRNAPFVVKTNNAERMRIDGSGNVAIGGSIAGKLHVSGGSIRQTNLTDGTDGFLQYNSAGTRVGSTYGFGTTYYRVQADSGVGRLALNTVSGYINFEVNAVEKMRMTNNGEFLIGGTASRPLSAGAPMKLQVESIDNTGGLSTTRNTADSFGPNIRMLKTRGTAVGAVTAVTSGDWLGQLQWYGTDGTNILPAAEIRADVDTGPGTNDMPGRLVFSTTADGGSTVTERMRLDSAGNLAIGRIPSTVQPTMFEASDTVAAGGIYRLATLRAVRTTADYTVRLGFGGYRDVDADSLIASIDAEAVNGTVNAGLAHGGHLVFRTSADGATANTLERMRITSAGKVVIGNTSVVSSVYSAGAVVAGLSGYDNTEGGSAIFLMRNDATNAAATPLLSLGRSRNATVGSHTVVTVGDTLGAVNFVGSDGSAFREAAKIIAQQDGGTPSATSMAGRLAFYTTASASVTPTERARITSAGELLVNQTTATGDAKIQVSNGVRFGGTTSTDVNTLDFYQEGTFTPVVAGSTTAGTGTYTTQVGTYTRIGNTVHFNVTVVWTAHTGTGNLLVNGLPFTSNATANRIYSVSVSSSNLTFTGQLGGRISNSATSIAIETQSSGAAIAALAIDTAASLWITGTYQV